ncbi:MAG: Maf family protein [Holophagaceae bacterium]|uniref:Maf family protein n=1 Tax=Candidatus Geothrix odensensis TaxID=2954440 RepID=A0A936F3B0_9BACT|nr:Maf family protein [Candidatus Geothrix odensensis]
MDKAGSYAIQGIGALLFIEAVQGASPPSWGSPWSGWGPCSATWAC